MGQARPADIQLEQALLAPQHLARAQLLDPLGIDPRIAAGRNAMIRLGGTDQSEKGKEEKYDWLHERTHFIAVGKLAKARLRHKA